MLHEPGVREDNAHVKTYEKCIEYQTMKTAILDVYINRGDPDKYYGLAHMFRDIIEETMILNKKKIFELLEERKKNNPQIQHYNSFYGKSEIIDYVALSNKFEIYLTN